MPQAIIRVFREASGTIHLADWLSELEEKEPEADAKCLHVILELERLGYELSMPHAEPLRDGIRELRTRFKKVRYRILYFFRGPNTAVLSHGIAKKTRQTPAHEIDLAIKRKQLIGQAEHKYLAQWEL
jgi:phage-related protein